MCGEKGALLACIRCLKLYHLICLGVTPLCLPLSEWACTSCSQDYQTSLLESLDNLLASQMAEKQSLLRKISNKLNKTQKNTKLRDFEHKHPELVRHGQIVYPIDDKLLWSKPRLHQVEFVKQPPEHSFIHSTEEFEDLIHICDFSYNFHSSLGTPVIKCEQLYTALAANEETPLNKQLLIALIKPLVELMLKNEAYRKAGRMLNYLVYKMRKTVPLDTFLEHSYLTFVENIFQTDIWRDVIEDFDKELMHAFEVFSFAEKYHSLPVPYKLKLLMLLTVLLLETKAFNDECNRRLDMQVGLMREYNELYSALKNKKHNNLKSDLESRSEEIRLQLRGVQVRTVGLGSDRYLKEFYFFPWDNSRLFVRSSEANNRECLRWGYFDKKYEVEGLVASLSEKGCSEARLLESLRSLLESNYLVSNESESTSSEMGEEKKHTAVYTLDSLKIWVKDLHISIADALLVPPCASFLDSLDSADLPGCQELILKFHQAFIGYKYPEEALRATDKVVGLWDFCELYSIWETSVKECENISEIYLCMHLLGPIVARFNVNNKTVEIVESAYSIARRSYRIERLSKLKKEVVKEQDVVCYVCGECGLVACCDTCPKVAHLECIGVSSLPDGEWHCPICVEKTNNIRVTRSKQIKY